MKKVNQHDDLNSPALAYAQREIVALHQEATVAESIADLRGRQLAEKIVYFYVVDSENRLVGVLPVRRLLMAAADTPIRTLMVTAVKYVTTEATLHDAADLMHRHRLLAIPVVDTDRTLLGVVDVSLFSSDLPLHEGANLDTTFQLIGVHVAQGKAPRLSFSVRDRLPWLSFNIVGGLICGAIIARFEIWPGLLVMLSAFIPVVLAVAESVSMQSTSLSLQRLVLGNMSPKQLIRSLRHEMIVALWLALASGLAVALLTWLWRQNWGVTIAVGGGVAAAVMLAAGLGVVLPALIRMWKADLRVAAGPIVLAATDILALLVLFGLAASVME